MKFLAFILPFFIANAMASVVLIRPADITPETGYYTTAGLSVFDFESSSLTVINSGCGPCSDPPLDSENLSLCFKKYLWAHYYNKSRGISSHSTDWAITGGYSLKSNTTDDGTADEDRIYPYYSPYEFSNPASCTNDVADLAECIAAPEEDQFQYRYMKEDAVDAASWVNDTYNRLTFVGKFVDVENAITDAIAGGNHMSLGMYIRESSDSRCYVETDEGTINGLHSYHHFRILRDYDGPQYFTVHWWPNYWRDQGVQYGSWEYKTGETGSYNYFDLITKFYWNSRQRDKSYYPVDTYLDSFRVQTDSNPDDLEYAHNTTAAYDEINDRVFVAWSRDPGDWTTDYAVKYAFSDIHVLGWAGATDAPGGTAIDPPGKSSAVEKMEYLSTAGAIDVSGESVIYVAVGRTDRVPTNFTQIVLPLE